MTKPTKLPQAAIRQGDRLRTSLEQVVPELPTDCAVLFALRDEIVIQQATLAALLQAIEQQIFEHCTA